MEVAVQDWALVAGGCRLKHRSELFCYATVPELGWEECPAARHCVCSVEGTTVDCVRSTGACYVQEDIPIIASDGGEKGVA